MSELPKFPEENELREAIEVVTESLNIVNVQGERGKWNKQALYILNLELKRRCEFVAQLEAFLKAVEGGAYLDGYLLLKEILEAFRVEAKK